MAGAPRTGSHRLHRPPVALVNPPYFRRIVRDNYCAFVPKSRYGWPPVDLLVLGGWLDESFEVTIMDAVAEGLSEDECLARLIPLRSECVFLMSSVSTWIEDARFVARIRRASPGTRVVVGYPRAGSGNRPVLDLFPAADAVLHDFSSSALRDYLCDDVVLGRALVVRDRDLPRVSRSRSASLDYPLPLHDRIVPGLYALPLGWSGGLTSVLTSFGCAHSCTFCQGRALSYRKRPLRSVLEELERIRDLAIPNVFFADYTFTTDRTYVLDLCRAMRERDMRFRWTCLARPDQLDEELAGAMKSQGCDLVQMGVESGNDETLRRYDKGFTTAEVRAAFAACRRAGVETLAFFIIGLPGEDRAAVHKTIDLAVELDPLLAAFAMPTPDPGTVLAAAAGDDGAPVISTVWPIVETETLSAQEIRRLWMYAQARFYGRPAYLARQLRSVRSAGELMEKALSGTNLAGFALKAALRTRIRNNRGNRSVGAEFLD